MLLPLVKICGTTSPADARLAIEAGADFVGLIMHPPSPRYVAPDVAAQVSEAAQGAQVLLVSVNLPLQTLLEVGKRLGAHAHQLHGDESPELVRELACQGCEVWKVLSGDEDALRRDAEIYTEAGAKALVVDARETTPDGIIYGGTGRVADWNAARQLVKDGYRVMLAGGLTPENVARAIETVQPWAVDAVSGVEARKGVKDAEKVRQFVRAAKGSSGIL